MESRRVPVPASQQTGMTKGTFRVLLCINRRRKPRLMGAKDGHGFWNLRIRLDIM